MQKMTNAYKLVCLFSIGFIFLLSNVAVAWQYSSDCVEGNGTTAEEQRCIDGTNHVVVHGAYSVKVIAGSAFNCTVRGDSNLLKHIITKVNDKQLEIDSDRSLCMKQPLEIEIQMPNLVSFCAEGAHEINIKNVHENKFAVELDGASLATIDGKVGQFKLNISGTSTLDAKRLVAQHVEVIAAGTTSAKIQVEGKLTVSASGIAEILYLGKPSKIKSNLSGLAEIAPLD